MNDKWEEALRGPPGTTVTPSLAAAPPAVPQAAETSEYQPWGREHSNVDDVIELRLKTGEWRQVFRPYLVAVEGIGDTTLTLLCTSYTVTLEGQHLAELRMLIKSRGVDFINEFDPKQWQEPGRGMPKIDRIEIVQARAMRPLPEPSGRR